MQSRTALVTGGTGGIGTSIVKRLASMGHRVATNYRDETKARAWQARMREEGVEVALAQGDVACPEQSERMVRAIFPDQTFARVKPSAGRDRTFAVAKAAGRVGFGQRQVRECAGF